MAKKDTKGDDEILQRARERFAYADEVDGDNRRNALEDAKFVYVPGEQWNQDTKARRKKWKLPTLEFNALKQFVNQTVNDQRQGRPGVLVLPAGEEASERAAELKGELIRGIEVRAMADAAYDTAFQHAVVGGRGYWRVISDYESPRSFNQCLKIKRIADPNAVRIDPDYQEADASDIAWGFVLETMRKADYERKYGEAPISWKPSDETALWYPADDKQTVFIADYYEITETEEELLLLDNGQVLWANDLEAKTQAGMVEPTARIVRKRDATRRRCDWYKLGGGEQIIEKFEWRGMYVPIVMCAGDEIVIDGRRYYQGLIRSARAPQQLMNYGMTQQAVRLSETPRPPWVAAVAAVKGYEKLYNQSNEEAFAMLPYHHADAAGNPIPMPQRQPGSDIDAGWAQWVQQMQGQIRSTLGLYENSIGMRAQETSGKAILARERQGDNSTFHYLDNLKRAIAHTGRVLEDLIPSYYDTQRLVPLVEKDGKQRMGQINGTKAVPDPANVALVQHIRDPDNDMTRGQFAVVVDSGPTDATKREETRNTLVELFRALPPAAQILGDKLIQVIDMPDARQAAERFKMLLPPAIQQMEAAMENGGRPPDPMMLQQLQQMQAQLQQAAQMAQQMQAEIQKLQQGEAAKVAEANADAAATVEKAKIDAAARVQAERVKVAGELLAEHMGMRHQAAMMGTGNGSGQPMPMDMDGMVQGLEMAEGQLDSAEKGEAPMPMPAMRQPAGPSPDTVLIIEAVGEIAKQVAAVVASALAAPRKLDVQTDSMGNVIGGVSTPMMMQ